MGPAKTEIIKVDGKYEDALLTTMGVVAESNREQMPVRLFEQGQRTMVSGVMPIRVALRALDYNSAEKGTTADEALNATNRPFIKEHAASFANYLSSALEKDEPFIIPPLTLNSTGELKIFVPKDAPGSGFAVLPDETALYITDGQHRFRGIQEVARKTRGTPQGSTLMNTGIPFMMTIESDVNQVHQDFADAGKTKALPPSLLAVYDTRQPANRAVMEITERVGLFKGRINATATSIGHSSPHIFLVNQVRQFVKYSLTGSTGTNELSFAEQAANAMTNPESRERWIRSRVSFLNAVTEIVPDWDEIAQLSPPGGADSAAVQQRTKEIKQRLNVPTNGAFLTTLGLVSYTVLRDATSTEVDEAELMTQIRQSLDPLKDVDWSREGSLWNGNIVTGGKIRTQAPAVKAASLMILEKLGLVDQESAAQNLE